MTLDKLLRNYCSNLDAQKIAMLLNWELADIAKYLDVDTIRLAHNSGAIKYQERLRALWHFTQRYAEVIHIPYHNPNFGQWLQTPQNSLENKSPKDAILEGKMDDVYDLLARVDFHD